MAFRREWLVAIDGFDPRFHDAGDDIDLCWRIRKRGGTLGFNPAAVVWHHPRDSVRAYWRQQRGYGRAEALLERKWPEKYNEAGHIRWQGRVYGNGLARGLFRRQGRVYHGTWNTGLFQRLYQPHPATLGSLSLLPEWHLATAGLAVVGVFGLFWAPLLLALVLGGLAVGVSVLQAALGGRRCACPGWRQKPARERAALLGLTMTLHLIQPLARLWGRVRNGLTPWRELAPRAGRMPRGRWTFWSERWRAPEDWLARIEARLAGMGIVTARGGGYDRWDLEVRAGLLLNLRLRTAVEEHGEGRQLLRFRARPRLSAIMTVLLVLLLVAAGAAASAGEWVPAAGLGALVAAVLVRTGRDCMAAAAALRQATLEIHGASRDHRRAPLWTADPEGRPQTPSPASQTAVNEQGPAA